MTTLNFGGHSLQLVVDELTHQETFELFKECLAQLTRDEIIESLRDVLDDDDELKKIAEEIMPEETT